jgi:hypothetical protein
MYFKFVKHSVSSDTHERETNFIVEVKTAEYNAVRD